MRSVDEAPTHATGVETERPREGRRYQSILPLPLRNVHGRQMLKLKET